MIEVVLGSQPKKLQESLHKAFENSPYGPAFSYCLEYMSKRCINEKNTPHLFYFIKSEIGDGEIVSYYNCLYCGTKKEHSANNRLKERIIDSKVGINEVLCTSSTLLSKILEGSNSKKEITIFAQLIAQLNERNSYPQGSP